jgi:ribonuclease HI
LVWEGKSFSPIPTATTEAPERIPSPAPGEATVPLEEPKELGAAVEEFPAYKGPYTVQFAESELDNDLEEPLYFRLFRRRERWRKIGGEALIIEGVSEDWENGPPPLQTVVPQQTLYVGGKDIQMIKELQEEIDLGVARICQEEDVSYILKSFLVPKPGGEYRKILDCTPINTFIRRRKFKMEDQSVVSQVLQPSMWAVTVDITKAFHHIQVAERLRPYLCTRYNHSLMQYIAMPFGLSSAPRTFSRVMHHCITIARREWPLLTFVQYMDDILMLAQEEQHLVELVPQVIKFLKGLGWLISEKKSRLTPSQRFHYLGWEWSTTDMTVRLMKEKNNALKQTVRQWIARAERGNIVQVRALASVIGRLSQTRLQHRSASLYLTFLNALKTKVVRDSGWEAQVKMNRSVLRDLLWWKQVLHNNTPYSLLIPKIQAEMWTDASPLGWGAVVPYNDTKLFAQGQWTNDWSSNKRELVAVQMAIRHFSKIPETNSFRSWLIHSDNQTTVFNINRRACAMSLLFPMRSLFNELLRRERTIVARYVRGVNNADADSLSRLSRAGDYSLSEGTLQKIISELKTTIDCDLFANSRNKQHHRYVTLSLKDKRALARDAFSIQWKHLGVPLVHPPIPLIQRCLNKIRDEKIVAIVVTPLWLGQWWSTALRAMTVRSVVLGETQTILKKGPLMLKFGDKLPPGQIAAHLVRGEMI